MQNSGLRWIAVLILAVCNPAATSATAAQPETAVPEDVRPMHERLVALSRGEGSMSDLRIELVDRSRVSHRNFNLEAGVLTSTEWRSPGSPAVRREGAVPESRISELLQQLIAKRYWTFQGTRFVPDAPMFLFRFHYRELQPVDFRCDAEEWERSETHHEIRNLLLEFVANTEMRNLPANP